MKIGPNEFRAPSLPLYRSTSRFSHYFEGKALFSTCDRKEEDDNLPKWNNDEKGRQSCKQRQTTADFAAVVVAGQFAKEHDDHIPGTVTSFQSYIN